MQRTKPIQPASDIHEQAQAGVEALFKKVDLSSFAAIEGFLEENFKKLEVMLSQKLVVILDKLAHLMPKKEKLTILSLGCGFAEEFLALKYICGDTQLNYVGVDIKEEQNQKARAAYRDFPELTLLTCDATDRIALAAALQENGCLPPHGFDLIVLRQPNIASPECGFAFALMMQNIIPFFAAVDGKAFISCYNEIEFGLVRDNLPNKFYSFSRGNAVMDGSKSGVQFVDGLCLQPDRFSAIVSCHGLALKNPHKLRLDSYSSHSLHSVRDLPYQEVLAQVKEYNPHASIIEAVKAKKYGVALRKACVMGDTKLVEILLAAQPLLRFDINESAENNNWTALDCAQNINPEKKGEIIKLLLANDAKTAEQMLAVKLVAN